MASGRKRVANRQNAALSTGPRDTTQSRMNALKHGILARETLILAGEGQEDAALARLRQPGDRALARRE